MNKYNPKSSKFPKIKAPTYGAEFSFVTISLFLLKLYSIDAYTSITYFTCCLPLMLYLVINTFSYLLSFIQLMHIEDEKELMDEGSFMGILSLNQVRLLQKIAFNLLGYFGIYFLTGQLDNFIVANVESYDKIQVMPAAVAIEMALLVKLYMNFRTR